jgi:hypothetical protein
MTLKYAVRGAAAAERARRQMRRTGNSPWGRPLWTKEEEQIIKELHPDYKSIKKKLRRRSLVAIRSRAGKLGLTKKIYIWKASEIARLRKLYATAPREEIKAAFPHVTWGQIDNCCQYHKIYRKRKPFVPTGFLILDEIRKRAFEQKLSMPDLDGISQTGKYFQKAKWFGKQNPNARAVLRAIKALDGKIIIQWE